jgi:hypothetical protein
MAAALGHRDEVLTYTATADRHGIVVAQDQPPDAASQLLP